MKVPLHTALLAMRDGLPSEAQKRIVDVAIKEMQRLQEIERAAVAIAHAWTSDGAARPVDRHPLYYQILQHADPDVPVVFAEEECVNA